jgi:hypothetical protein
MLMGLRLREAFIATCSMTHERFVRRFLIVSWEMMKWKGTGLIPPRYRGLPESQMTETRFIMIQCERLSHLGSETLLNIM